MNLIQIIFNRDFVQGDVLTIKDSSGVHNYNFVFTYTFTYDVEAGTPTSLAGETTAINFANRVVGGYGVSQDGNTVTLSDPTITFSQVVATDHLGNFYNVPLDYDFRVSNDTSAVTIKVLSHSPYYLYVPWLHPTLETIQTDYTIKLYTWGGSILSVPTNPEYEIKKSNVLNTSEIEKVDIARLLNDFILFNPIRSTGTQIVNAGNNTRFFKVEVFYESETTAEIESTGVFMQGYGYGDEGENTQPPDNKIYLPNTEYDVSRSTLFNIPIETSDSALSYSVVSSPSSLINFSGSTSATDVQNSNSFIKYIQIDVSEAVNENYITFTYDGNTVLLYIKDEFKYTPYTIHYKNKQGHQQSMAFFKERRDDLSITSESYESSFGQPSDGYHQFVEFNKNGKDSIKLSTGFIQEVNNEDIRQLMLSDRVYIYENEKLLPVNVKQSRLSFKNRVNDRLVNYTIDFEYAFNKINNI